MKRLEFAQSIARKIFECGDEHIDFGGKTQRIQFMGGKYPTAEVAMGGFSEAALAMAIDSIIRNMAVLVVDTKDVKPNEQCPIMGRFATAEEASDFITTLVEYETGRYQIDEFVTVHLWDSDGAED